MRRDALILGASLLLMTEATAPVSAQVRQATGDEDVEAYLRAAGVYFGVHPNEVLILAEWRLHPEEVPVLLFMARAAGVSPDALAASRRDGASWSELAARFGIGAGAFFVDVGGGDPGAALFRAYERFRERPRSDWGAIRLDDREITMLVNLKFLAGHLRHPPRRILEAWESEASFVGVFSQLSRARSARRSHL
jgi:hypothetical protein